jgi:hypothetical protein
MKTLLFSILLALLGGCAVTPSTIVQETRSARPALAEVAPPPMARSTTPGVTARCSKTAARARSATC